MCDVWFVVDLVWLLCVFDEIVLLVDGVVLVDIVCYLLL